MKSKNQNSPSEEELKRNHAMTRLFALYSSLQLHIDAEIEYRTYIEVSEQLAQLSLPGFSAIPVLEF